DDISDEHTLIARYNNRHIQSAGHAQASLWSRFFFFNHTASTEIYTLSLHDALPISGGRGRDARGARGGLARGHPSLGWPLANPRSEEHTSELQSRENLVCRLLLEKKKKIAERGIEHVRR